MTQTQQEINKLYTLQEDLDILTRKYESLQSVEVVAVQAKAHYDINTGNLTLENIELTIE